MELNLSFINNKSYKYVILHFDHFKLMFILW